MKSRKDMSVELARILACLIVIGAHSYLSVYYDDCYDLNRVFISCLCADGVAVFWLIMGGFLFNQINYKNLLIKTFKSIGIPMICMITFTFYLSGWLIDGDSLLQSITHTKEDYVYLFNLFLAWESPGEYLGHLWYLYTYFALILCFPILKCFVDYLDEKDERERIFLVISFLFLVVNDISNNRLAMFSHRSINALIPAALVVLWGHILYKNKDKFLKPRTALLSIITFIALNGVRTVVQFQHFSVDKGNHISYWYTGVGMVCAISLMTFCFSLVEKVGHNVKKIVGFVAGHTFTVYLIHLLVIAKLQKCNFQDKLYHLVPLNDTYVGEFIYTGCIVLVIFFISISISILFKWISKIFKNGKQCCRENIFTKRV